MKLIMLEMPLLMLKHFIVQVKVVWELMKWHSCKYLFKKKKKKNNDNNNKRILFI